MMMSSSSRSPACAAVTSVGAGRFAARPGRAARRAPRVATTSALGDTLPMYLARESARGHIDGELAIALNSVAVACKRVRALVASAPLAGNTGSLGSSNASGDEQKKLDVLANDVFVAEIRDSGRAGIIVTEEEDTPIAVERCVGGEYIVTFDPIDGSSNIDACVTTGSIFGVYSPGECRVDDTDSAESAIEKCLTNTRQSGEQLVAAGYCMFSSSCVFMLTTGDGVFQFDFDPDVGEFVMSKENVMVPDGDKMQRIYSGNNGNVNLWAPELKKYVSYLQAGGKDGGKPFSYRYIGALIGDAHRTLLYGGLWLYPPDANAKEGKARLLYEVAPIAFIFEQAGGMATHGPLADKRVMEVVPQHIHQKHPMFVGSKSMVEDLQRFLKEV